MRGNRHIILFLVLLAIFFASHIFIFGRNQNISSDAASYAAMANSILDGKGLIDPGSEAVSDREPMLPVFLAGIFLLAGRNPQHALLLQSVFLAFCIWFLAIQLEKHIGFLKSSLTAFATALWPGVAVTAVCTFLPETLALASVCLGMGFFLAENSSLKKYILTGIFFSLAALTRFPLMFFIAPAMVWGFIFRKKLNLNDRLAFAAPAFFLIPIMIWGFYNLHRNGKFTVIGSKGGNEILVRAEKLDFNGSDFNSYMVGSVLGDFWARKIYPAYAENVEPKTYGSEIRRVYSDNYFKISQDPDKIRQEAVASAIQKIRNQPLKFFWGGVAELFKLNGPMLWYNAADMRHLFAGTHPNLPDWLKGGFILLYLGLFYLIEFLVFVWVMWRGLLNAHWWIPALFVLYVNGIYFIFDSYPRYLMPAYAFYALFVILIFSEKHWRRSLPNDNIK